MDLHGVGSPPGKGTREDHRPHHKVVGERHIGADPLSHLPHGLHIGLDVCLDLSL